MRTVQECLRTSRLEDAIVRAALLRRRRLEYWLPRLGVGLLVLTGLGVSAYQAWVAAAIVAATPSVIVQAEPSGAQAPTEQQTVNSSNTQIPGSALDQSELSLRLTNHLGDLPLGETP